MTAMCFASAVELSGALRSREISSRELLELFVARVERYGPAVNAVVALDLLRWQCNCLDREALEKLSGCAEVAGTFGRATLPRSPDQTPAVALDPVTAEQQLRPTSNG